MHTLCWSLALYYAGQQEAAAEKLKQVKACNRYVLPRLFSGVLPTMGVDHYERIREMLELDDIPAENYAL